MSARDNGGRIDGEDMYLRDWFAGQALAGGDLTGYEPAENAKWAYEIADAMLRERAKAEGQS